MKLGKFGQWRYRKRLTSQFKTFGQLQKGDFVWRVDIRSNGEIVKTVYKLDKVRLRRTQNFKLKSIHLCLLTDYAWGDDYCLDFNDIEYANVNFVYQPEKDNSMYFSNEKICDNFIKTKVIKRNKSIEKRDVLHDIECAVNNANEFLREELDRKK